MSLTILNSVSSMTAENALSTTQANLQKTLTQLSTGMKINSGSDDAAGLSIATGMQANMAALTQSQQNASNGIGMLQTADGALSQVTTLLNRAVTLATEASNSGITTGVNSQAAALQNEFASIKNEIDQIGNTTDFNGQNVFTSNSPTSFSSTQASITDATVLGANESVTISDAKTGGTFVYAPGVASTVGALNTAIGAAVTNGTLSANVTASDASGNEVIAEGATDSGITVSTNAAALGPMVAAASGNTNTVYLSDGANGATATTNQANDTITTAISALSSAALGLTTDNLNSVGAAQTALGNITTAINTISAQRGVIGASVNRLTAATSNMSNAVTNLQSATDSIENADIGHTVANMTQYNVLQSTGMAALQQSNQAQQAVLKLVQ
jgi:flagellin